MCAGRGIVRPGDGSFRLGVGGVGQAQRAAVHHHRVHHAAGPAIRRRGCGHRGATLLSMRDVIRLASQSHHYLVIYDEHTREPLYCGRAKRFATPGQRVVLHALDRGCTSPGCTAPGYWCQVHHVDGWAKDEGNQHHQTHPGLRTRQPPRRRGRLDHPETQRRPYGMDPTATPRYRAVSGSTTTTTRRSTYCLKTTIP